MACLAPFAGKAFHIDDPLFVWTAQHIREQPRDFYGFSVNWYFWSMPMSEVTKNPPLACYYLALVGAIFGWSEISLHIALLLPAIGMLWGTYRLAEFFGSRPLVAALVTLLTPAFLVSSSTVMCDTILGFFWVWALVCWERASRQDRPWLLLGSGFLIGLSAFTKYFGISLVPLLLVYSIASRQKLGRTLTALAIPLAMIGAYQWLTQDMYGHGLLQEAAGYASAVQKHSATRIPATAKFLVGLAFTGGCSASAVFFVPFLWPKRWFWPALGCVAGDDLAVVLPRRVRSFSVDRGRQAAVGPHYPGGAFLCRRHLHPRAGWRGSSRAPGRRGAAPGFVGRRDFCLYRVCELVDQRPIDSSDGSRGGHPGDAPPRLGAWTRERPDRMATFLAVGSCSALGHFGDSGRLSGRNAARAAATLANSLPERAGKLWFQGHWGFQYYMQALGAQCLDSNNVHCEVGDWIVQPDDNYGGFAMPPETTRERGVLRVPACPWATTMHRLLGAGFYSNRKGPLPFTFGAVPDGEYLLLEVVKPVDGALRLMR